MKHSLKMMDAIERVRDAYAWLPEDRRVKRGVKSLTAKALIHDAELALAKLREYMEDVERGK